MTSRRTTLVSSWHTPTELSVEEYDDLLTEIRSSLKDSDETSDKGHNKDDEESDDDDDTVPMNPQAFEFQLLVSIWGPELLDAARYNEIDVVRAILQVSLESTIATEKNNSKTSNNDCSWSAIGMDSILNYSDDSSSGNTAWHMAAANGHVAILQLLHTVHLYRPEPPPTTTTSSGDSSLAVAVASAICPAMRRNRSGNTPLHWAAANGHAPVVEFLLQMGGGGQNANDYYYSSIDVLRKNQAGRSILTEGFGSSKERVIELLLSHDSACEERLVGSGASVSLKSGNDHPAPDSEPCASSTTPALASVTHDFCFGPRGNHDNGAVAVEEYTTTVGTHTVALCIRELAMATHQDDSILGQEPDGSQDTTGYSVWAASLVLAQWLAHESAALLPQLESQAPSPKDGQYDNDKDNDDDMVVVELGAGCGVPGLVAAAILAAQKRPAGTSSRVYLTDFNQVSVDNCRYNITLNETKAPWNNDNETTSVSVQAAVMNWQDSSTWPEPLQHIARNDSGQQNGGGGVNVLLGSDLIYQDDMVPLLLQTVLALRPWRFLYVAHSRRAGHAAFLAALAASRWFDHGTTSGGPTTAGVNGGGGGPHNAPPHYRANPLVSQDDEECFVHFHELVSGSDDTNDDDDGHGFVLYDFVRARRPHHDDATPREAI
jgi:Lysine methyltransferase/Ankyrin repeats (3 copies)